MIWREPPSCYDSAMERQAIEEGWTIDPVFRENMGGYVKYNESIPSWQREPAPKKNNLPHIYDLVVTDLNARKEMGVKKYGTPLQPFNGRKALKDAYEEVLDLALYLRQALYEQDNK